MKVDLFDFHLPSEAIATEPMEPREHARLLHVGADGSLADHRIGDLPSLLRRGDLLIFNDTKVIPAQLEGLREREGTEGPLRTPIGATLHRRTGEASWLAFVRGARKLRPGDAVIFGDEPDMLRGEAIRRADDGSWEFAFDVPDGGMIPALSRVGAMPLPPYISAKRKTRVSDMTDYQTMFADREGAVAAPTAGLHFTPDLTKALMDAGIEMAGVTLHVGAGTFLPVKVDDTDDHSMHTEWGELGTDTARRIVEARSNGGRIVAVGTTSLRVLEASAQAHGEVAAWSGETDIFITPGHTFASADLLLTNFHLPRSTLLMLVSAFSGFDEIRAAYRHAIDTGYRFYSYGDACLLELNRQASRRPDAS